MTRALLILFFFGLTSSLHGQEYGFDIYNQDNGLASSYAYDITQDKAGNICLATENGLVTFNGYSFSTYDTLNGLSENLVSQVAACSDGSLIVGHFQEGISYGLRNFATVNQSPLTTRITGLIEIAPGKVLIGTRGSGLFVMTTADGKTEKLNLEGLESVNAICSVGSRYIAVATDLGLTILTNEMGVLSFEYAVPELMDKNILAMGSDSMGSVFAAVQDEGIARIATKAGYFTCVIETMEDLFLPSGTVTDLCCDNMGNFYVSIMGEGLFQFSYFDNPEYVFNRLVLSFTIMNGLTTNNIQSLFIDSENNLWIGTYGKGILKYADRRFFKINYAYLGRPSPITALCWFSTKYYAGSDNGLQEVRTDQQGQVSLTPVGDSLGLPKGPVNFLESRNEKMYIVSNQNQLSVVSSGKRSTTIRIPFRNTTTIINDVTSSGDELYLATSEGLFIYNGKQSEFSIYTTDNGLLHNNVKSAMRDSKGRIWIASPASKISYLDDNGIHSPQVMTEDRPYLVHCILEDSRGNIWMGTDGDGILKYDGSALERITVDSGLLSNYVYSLSIASDNSIWAIHNRGLSRIIETDRITVKSYTGPLDFASSEFVASAVMSLPMGTIYFGTSTGILGYTLSNDYPNPRSPYCNIISARFNAQLFSPTDKIQLDYGKYTVQFDFLGISHRDPTKLIYKYKLVGVDEEWRTSDYSQRFAAYPQLTDGDYTFQVYCYSPENPLVSDVATIHFNIGIPFWKSAWFYVLLIAALILSVYLYVRWQVQNYKTRQIQLQAIIAEKTSELTKEKEELLVTKNLLEEVNQDTADSIAYAKQIQEVMLPSRDSILNKFPDSIIYHRASHVVSGDFFWFSETEENYVIGVIDCTGHGVPGAFMSLIAANLLDKTITNRKIISPVDILYAMDASTVEALHQDDQRSTSRDGMDIAICSISKDKKKLRFGGAGRPLYLVRDGVLTEYKGSKISIGGYYAGVKKKFTEQEIEIQPGDVIYLSSDGYADQFNGDNEKKYSSKRLRELLASIAHLEAGWQYVQLHTSFEDWKGGTRQIDDVTIVGFKI